MAYTETQVQIIILALRKVSGPSHYANYVSVAAYDYQSLPDMEKLIAEIKLDYHDNPRMVTELLGDNIIKLLDLKPVHA